jgi:hypothetical protein
MKRKDQMRKGKGIGLMFVLLACTAISLMGFTPKKGKQLSVAEFGAKPDDGQNDAEQLRKAISYCKENPGTTLTFGPGVYDFRDEEAVRQMKDAMSGKYGANPQDKMFDYYFKYVMGLNFNGVRDLTIQATGATLLCDGWMEPVSLNNCSNVKITGLKIDFKRKPHSTGTIVDVQPEWFDVEYDNMYPMDSTMSLCRTAVWNVAAGRQDMHFGEDYFPPFKVIAPQKLRVLRKIDPSAVGNLLYTPHSFHFRPAILIHEAKNIKLVDVTIHSQPGMGIVGHRSENITMIGLHIVPSAGWIQSTNTDATHFTSCKGLIRYEDCQIGGQGDDGVNIHNYYLTIQKPAKGAGYDLVVKGADLHAQKLDYPDLGDTMELVNAKTLAVVKKVVVKTRVNNFEEKRTQVTLDKELPADIENYYLINITRLPRVEIVGCVFFNNRSRCVLIKTRNVLIERCLFQECTGAAIHVGAEGSWHEGPGSANVIICNNRMIRCSGGGVAVNGGEAVGIHKNILIEGNIMESDNGGTGVMIEGVSGMVVRYNEFAGYDNPYTISRSENIKIYSNQGATDFEAKEVQ